jgi:hypothetical protein
MLHDLPTIAELGGMTKVLAVSMKGDTRFSWTAFNPSLALLDDRLRVTVRSSNYKIAPDGTYVILGYGRYINELWTGELTEKLELTNMRLVSQEEHNLRRGLEDARLYVKDGRMRMCAIGLETWIPRARVVDCELDDNLEKITAVRVLEGPEKDRIEKNWMPVSYVKAKFDYMYSPQVVVKDGQFVKVQPQGDDTDGLRGGSTLVPFEDGLLCVMHKTFILSGSPEFDPKTFSTKVFRRRKYTHYFVKVSLDGVITAVSKGFYFNGPGVEFASGLVVINDKVVITYGNNDAEAKIATLSIETVKNMLSR